MVALAAPTITTAAPHIPLSEFALRSQTTEHLVRKALARGVISPPKFGRYYAFPVDRVGDYRKAMEAAGIVGPAAVTSASLATA